MDTTFGVAADYQIPDALWAQIAPLLPAPQPKKKDGRPRMNDRNAMTAIFYLLRTGCQWAALPRSLGAKSTVHDRFQEWVEAGVFAELWRQGLLVYDEQVGIDWLWQAMDGAMTKAPLGGEKNGPQSDRPRQVRDQTQPADRRSRHTAGHRG